MTTEWKNRLYFGDNLEILRDHVPAESVDLIYLDPPFNSNATYNVLFKERSGERSAAQIMAFEDTWEWGPEPQRALDQLVMHGVPKVSQLMDALSRFLGKSNMLAYLVMMGERLVELQRVLKPTGSIYLHCDPTASHYLKLIMDAVFEPVAFRNEITWQRTNAHSDAKRWSPLADIILYYSKSDKYTWNPPFAAHSDQYVASKYRFTEPDGRRYQLDNMTSPHPRPNMMYEWKGHKHPPFGWRYSKETMAKLDAEGRVWYPDDKSKRPRLKRYLDEMRGVLLGNIWTDIAPINSQAQERLGYPTQKPETLLERIIRASSNEGDVVLDPFCGCGTAVAAAERLHRRWVGIDITYLAIDLIKRRLQKTYGGDLVPYEILGVPVDLSGARALALTEDGRYKFESWALGLVDAHPAHGRKKGADSGVDGYIYFKDDDSGQHRKVVVQVKSGHVTRSQIGDLIAVMQREKAEMAAFVTLEEPTKPMRDEALSAGFYVPSLGAHHQVPRVQILTIAELLEERKVQIPRWAADATFKAAQRKGKQTAVQGELAL